MESYNVKFKNENGEDISGIVEYPYGGKNLPCVVIAHGLGSHKAYLPLVKLSSDLVNNNFATLRFDFTNDGGPDRDTYNEELHNANFLKHQEMEMNSAIKFVKSLEFVDSERVGITGHSFGGLVCLAISVNRKDLKAVVTLASPAKSRSKIFNESNIKDIHIPLRIVHGENDMIVHKIDAENIFKNANDPKDLKIIPEADHLFRKDEFYKPMSEAVIEWMKKNL